jgi:GT2 family glycosyltransferase
VTDKIHILLPVHNRRDITYRFIESLKAQTRQDYHLILIDDGSTDGTEEMVRDHINDLTVIRGQGDWWWAGSLQQGYNWLKSHEVPLTDPLLIINDDTEFKADFLETALKILSQNTKTLLLAQCYSRENGQLIDAGVHVDWGRMSFEPAKTSDQINCFSTRGLFLRIADFYEIGGFYPKVLSHYLSDYEFTIRAHRKGMRLRSDPSLKLWLDEKTTGYHQFVNEPLVRVLKKQFSKKSAANPLAWSAFLILACPWPWKVPNLLRIWVAFCCALPYLILSPKRLMKRLI